MVIVEAAIVSVHAAVTDRVKFERNWAFFRGRQPWVTRCSDRSLALSSKEHMPTDICLFPQGALCQIVS